MSLRSTLGLPREHGAWAMFYVPFMLGILVAGRVSLPVLLLLLATSAVFISRESLLIWWRSRSRGRKTLASRRAGRLLLVYLASAVASGVPLILFYRLYWLLPLALIGGVLLVVNGKQGTRLEDRSVTSEVLAIVGLTLTAPAAYYVARGEWDQWAVWLWMLSSAYFASSVFYVKLRVTGLHARRPDDRRRARWQCIAYHVFLLTALSVLSITGSLSLFVLLAFTPALIRTLWSLLKPAPSLNLKRIGITEIVYALIFLLFTTLTFGMAE